MNQIVLTGYRDALCFSLWENGQVMELALYEQEPGLTLGDICLARVEDIVPGIQAAFVGLTPKQRAYLPLEQAPPGLRCGDELPVQLVKEAQKTKDPVATGWISITGRLAVLVTDQTQIRISSKISDAAWKEAAKERVEQLFASESDLPYGFIIRTGAYHASFDELCREIEEMVKQYRVICQAAATRSCYSRLLRSDPAWLTRLYSLAGNSTNEYEVVTDLPDIYERCQEFLARHNMTSLISLRMYTDASYSLEKLYSLDTVRENALAKHVWLKSGGYLVIEPTEAMVVIDVNTGKAKGKKPKEEMILRLNLEAAAEIARQLRLRNLSGIILIDFIDMKQNAHREQLMRALQEAVRMDPVGVSVIDMTKLGLVECTRRKVARPLHEQVKHATI